MYLELYKATKQKDINMKNQIELETTAHINPLDNVEEVLHSNNWIFSRLNQDELTVEVTGAACGYRLFFIWQESMNAMQLYCQYDFEINGDNKHHAAMALMNMNETLWMGHFELTKGTLSPCFRQTCLLRGDAQKGAEYIEDLVDISLAQCERFYTVFNMLSGDAPVTQDVLSFAMMDTVGES